jgi:hypothetical protein
LLLASVGCTPTPPSADSIMAELRKHTEFAATFEENAGDLPAVTYQSAADKWTRVRAAHEDAIKKLPERADELRSRIAMIDKRLALLRAEEDYAANIEVRDLQRARGTRTHFGLPAEGIFGEVKNRGDHTVTRLELKFELLDASGKPVGEDEYTVAYPGVKDPLKPNYTLPFGKAVDKPPSDWVGVRGAVKLVRLSREGMQFTENAKSASTR